MTPQATQTAAKPKTADMHPGPGFRVRHDIERPDKAIVDGLGQFETPAISDQLNRLYTMMPSIRNLTDEHLTILGPAVTVKSYPGDNLMVHKSLDIAQPGDVIVVDGHRSPLTAALGDLVSKKARHRGVAGFVVDGVIRDLPEIKRLGDFPVYARDVTPIGPMHRGPGEINYPIACGGVVVNPGDIIVGDQDGLLAFAPRLAATVIEKALAQAEKEEATMQAIRDGRWDRSFVDALEARCAN